MRFIGLLYILLISNQLVAQTNPAPAPKQKGTIVIDHATIHIGNGNVLKNSKIIFTQGKIDFVGESSTNNNPKESVIIDGTGKHLYPGLIAMMNNTGLIELPSVRATRDAAEVGRFNPSLRSCIAYNTDSQVIPTIRANGIALTQPAPEGGIISGQSSVMQMDAWNWEDALYKEDIAVHLNWPIKVVEEPRRGAFGMPNTDGPNYESKIREIKAFFDEARAYNNTSKQVEMNLKMESVRGLFSGTKKLFINVDQAPAILDAVEFLQKNKIQGVIVGGTEAHLVGSTLAEKKIPVVVGRTQSLPENDDDGIFLPFAQPGMLVKQGVEVAISIGGHWQPRNLPFQAGQAVGHGLPYEEAIKCITSNPAKILGISDRTGTLEIGKDANIVLSEGDILDMKSSKVIKLFIQGRDVVLANKQIDLYQKYSKKYGHQ